MLGKLGFGDFDDAIALLSDSVRYAVIGKFNLGIYGKADGRYARKYYREAPDGSDWGLLLLALSAATKGWVDPRLGWELMGMKAGKSATLQDHVYFVAKMKDGKSDGVGLVRVRRDTGDVDGEVFFGSKTPSFAIDADGRLYFLSNSKTMLCHQF